MHNLFTAIGTIKLFFKLDEPQRTPFISSYNSVSLFVIRSLKYLAANDSVGKVFICLTIYCSITVLSVSHYLYPVLASLPMMSGISLATYVLY